MTSNPGGTWISHASRLPERAVGTESSDLTSLNPVGGVKTLSKIIVLAQKKKKSQDSGNEQIANILVFFFVGGVDVFLALVAHDVVLRSDDTG